MVSHVLLAAIVALLAFASSVQSAQLYHREGALDLTAARPTTHNTWSATSVAPATASHSITIAMHFHNHAHLEQLFQDIHDPTHPSWLNHLSRQELHDIIAPPKQTTDRLLAWMTEERGVPAEHIQYLMGANAIRVESTVDNINRLFNTTLHEFTHTDGRTAVRQLGASYVADEFVSLIQHVDGLAMMPYVMKRRGLLVELDARQQKSSKAATTATTTTSSSNDNRHATPVASPIAVLNQSSFTPIFPANSLYRWYSIDDQSKSSYSTNPITSTATVQFYTSDTNGNLQANSFSPSDLQKYSSLWSQSASSSALHVWTVRGANSASNPTDEPTLDVQSITSLNPVAANQFELTASGKQQYWWASDFVSRDNIAQVVSISYGIDESVFLTTASSYANSQQDGILLSNYLSATNNLFMAIGARGTTILASSGDDGAQGTAGRDFITNGVCDYTQNPYDRTTPHGPTAEFPAISPYVTAVGATEINAPNSAFPAQLSGSTSPWCSSLTTSKLPQYGVQQPSSSYAFHCFDPSLAGSSTSETAVSIANSSYTSGGGFSRFFSRSAQASWQNTVVNTYLSSSGARTPTAQYFNRTGRAIPDVSIFGAYFPLILNGAVSQAAGTSLSSPLFAAIIALLNRQTLIAKNATIGFANPLLYQMAANSINTFRDITTGSNYCPAGKTECDHTSCQGYTATTGWDPVTGLGVPNVAAMQSALGQYLTLVRGNNTGSVTGISGAMGAASGSVWLAMVVVVVAGVMSVLVL